MRAGYDEMQSDRLARIGGIRNPIELNADKRNTIIRVSRAAKTAMKAFDDIPKKPKLDRPILRVS